MIEGYTEFERSILLGRRPRKVVANLSFICTTKGWWGQGPVVGKTKRHSEFQFRRYEEYKASMTKAAAKSWIGLADS